jgi:hypothetical protein
MSQKEGKNVSKVSDDKLSKTFYCKECDYNTVYKSNFTKHKLTASHLTKIQFVLKVSHEKVSKCFCCHVCEYTTSYKSNLTKHQTRASHFEVSAKLPTHICFCGKEYKYLMGLTKHKLKCKVGDTKMILDILKNNQEIMNDNKEFKEMLVEQHKQLIAIASEKTTIINNNTQNNNTQNNMTFNLNTFLNEKCKDAINLTDFINSMQVSFEDLENTGKNGFVKSLSQCITRELGKLDVYSRPIHCSDSKRKVIHIKNANEWQRDADEHPETKRMLSKINHTMNVSQVLKWKDTYPSCELSNDKRNTLYLKIVRNMVEGEDDTYERVITQISENIAIDKGTQKHMMLTN